MVLNKTLFRDYLTDHHISLRGLARKANISPSVLWRFFNTKTLLTTRNLMKLLNAVDLDEDELEPIFIYSKCSNSKTGESNHEIK